MYKIIAHACSLPSATLHIWPAYWGILVVNVVKVAEERKIKQHLLPIEDGEQMLHYSLELVEHGNTALRASGIHREMSYMWDLFYRLRTRNANLRLTVVHVTFPHDTGYV